MSSFTAPLQVEQMPGRDWILLRDLRFYLDDADGPAVCCTGGFVTDFASIPSVMWSVIGHPAGPYAAAAVVHDWLYRGGSLTDGCRPTRAEADRIFRTGMEVLGVGPVRRRLMWLAVRVGGFRAWQPAVELVV